MAVGLRDKIIALEQASKVLEPKGASLENLTSQVVAYGHKYLNQADNLKAYNKEFNPDNALQKLGFPEEGQDLEQLLEIIETNVDTPGINPASGNHLGYIPGGGVYP